MDGTSLERLEGLLEKLLHRLEAAGPAPKSYSMEGAAKALCVSDSTVRRMVGRGELRTVRIGKRLVVPASEVDRLLTPAPAPKKGRGRRSPPLLADELAAMKAAVKRR